MFLLLVLFSVLAAAQSSPTQRAKALLARMTLDQKITMLHGSNGPYVGQTAPIPELGIPALTMEDGPQGVADTVHGATAWPSAHTVAQSWDLALFRQFSGAMAKEQYVKGTGVMLGPMVNLARVAEGGRNFESLGEDPFLASRLVEESVRGIQEQGVMANVKHYIDNNFEGIPPASRLNISIQIDEETQFLYLQPFIAAVNAGVLSVMCSYNRVNYYFACENNYTLGLLKNQIGFKGFVVSDWGGTHSTVASALAGLDMEMGDAKYFSGALLAAVKNGQVPEALIDDKVMRVLTAMFTIGIFNRKGPVGNLTVNATSPEHTQLAQTLSARSMVLLKNSGQLLPLDVKRSLKIAIAGAGDIICGGGSGYVISTPDWVRAWDGLSAASPLWSVTHADTLPSAGPNCAKADVCIVIAGAHSSEGSDRPLLALDSSQLSLIEGILAYAVFL
jgi:beta-glucosidase